jgi:hypothetical protein
VWTLLDTVADGETWAVAMWSEWFAATKGKRAIVWSPGLKRRFDVVEVDDEGIAQAEVEGQVLDVIPSEKWLTWCRSLSPAGLVQAIEHLEHLEQIGAPA